MIEIAHSWGTTAAECARPFPCDRAAHLRDQVLWRGITIDAPAACAWRWLCQLRVAPYSYDLIDNFGRRSPQQLSAGLDQLAVGQTIMLMFELIDFAAPSVVDTAAVAHLTIAVKRWPRFKRLLGDAVISYVVVPVTPTRARLLVKLRMRYPHTPVGSIERVLVPWGDLVMMRRQLLNFKMLAERDAQSTVLHLA